MTVKIEMNASQGHIARGLGYGGCVDLKNKRNEDFFIEPPNRRIIIE